MIRVSACLIGLLFMSALFGQNTTVGQEIPDVIFSTPFPPNKHPTTANFEYNGRAIGKGREAFEDVLKRIRALPAGSSVVWGPNYDRCGSCSPTTLGCLPKHLYPDLWKKLETIVAEHRLTLSSMYPSSRARSTRRSVRVPFPKSLAFDQPSAHQQFDAVLNWEVGEILENWWQAPEGSMAFRDRAHRFSSSGKALNDFDLDLFFGRLPENAHVLMRVTLREEVVPKNEPNGMAAVADEVRAAWDWLIARGLGGIAFKATLSVPPVLAKELSDWPNGKETGLSLSWSNFHGPGTPHEEVLYFANDKYLGRGDQGFDQLLKQLRQLPPSSKITLPRYQYFGRWATETFSEEELESQNAKLRDIVPFAARKQELDAQIAERDLKLSFGMASAKRSPQTVLDWDSGDRYASEIASFGRIIHHDEQRRRAAARLGWIRYEASERWMRKLETEAIYTLDDAELGEGVAGFAKGMQKLMNLPEGSVVQVQVCLRTKGRFVCPLIYEGQRHFERTGFEPYFGMFPWLIDVAQKRKLKIEWLPDEQKSCGDCELNK